VPNAISGISEQHADFCYYFESAAVAVDSTRLPLSGVDSVHLQILLISTCEQCGLWSVAGHNHRKVIE